MHLTYLLPPIEFYSPQNGGALATFAMQQGKRLAKSGIKISVIAPHEEEEVYPIGEFHPLLNITRKALSPLQRGFSTKIRRRLAHYDWLYYEYYRSAAREKLLQLKPDAVLCMNDWQTPLFVKQTLPDTRVFLYLANECGSAMRDVQKSIDAIELICPISRYISEWTQKKYSIPDEKILLLPNGADLDTFYPAPDFETRANSPQTPLKALFISRIDPNKGPDLAIEAVRIAQQQGCAVELSIAGGTWFGPEVSKNPYLSALREAAQAVNGNMLGYVVRDKVPQLVREQDVMLLPLRNNDPMTQVVFEAMASGVAVITCPLGGVPEACGEAGLWAEPNNAGSVAELLISVCNDREKLAEYKRRSVKRASQMTWDNNAGRFERVLLSRGVAQ